MFCLGCGQRFYFWFCWLMCFLIWQVERCLRLLKAFSSKLFEPKSFGCGDSFEKEQLKFGRKFRKTEQLVELPVDHQIYDMVDAEGSEGLAVMEVCA